MSEYTRPATWEDVKNLARLLNDAGVQYALVGDIEASFALLHASPLTTLVN